VRKVSHIERNIKKLAHVSDNFIAEVESVLTKIWDIYFNLKQYKKLANHELKNKKLKSNLMP
jgi:hypothetical protein